MEIYQHKCEINRGRNNTVKDIKYTSFLLNISFIKLLHLSILVKVKNNNNKNIGFFIFIP